jgi:hypothetical protein
MSAATCPVCGQYVTSKGDTVYRGGLIPRHNNRLNDGPCGVAFGTKAANGPELVSATWTPKPRMRKTFGNWVFVVDSVEDGAVYGIMHYPDGASEEAGYSLGQWWARCLPEAENVPTLDKSFEIIVRDHIGRAIFASNEYEAGSVAFSLFRGDASLWEGK